MAKKPTTASAKIRAFYAKNPDVSVSTMAKQFGVGANTVYYALKTARRKYVKPAKQEVIDLSAAGSVLHQKIRMSPADKPEFGVSNVDLVNQPPHYTTGGIETIDFIEAKKLNYNLGNCVKYITRADHKGNRLQDLQKAKWYLEREILAQHI